MTNEELAIRIKSGETTLTAELWERVKRIIYRYVDHQLIADYKKERAVFLGITKDDLYQEGYFALVDAIKHYSPEKGHSFDSYLKFSTINSVDNALRIRTIAQWNNPVYRAISLDAPISSESEESFVDFLPDLEDSYERIIENAYLEQRKIDIRESIRSLSPVQRRVISCKYYLLMTLSDIGKSEGMSVQSVANVEMNALDILREDERIKKYRESVCYDHSKRKNIQEKLVHAYHTGVGRWRERGMSSVEETVFRHSEVDDEIKQKWMKYRKE